MSDKWLTRKTLLQRVQNSDDPQAWDHFVDYYKDFIFIVLKRMGLKTVECEDLRQEVLLKLWKNLKTFEINQKRAKFRTWLSTLIRNRTIDYLRNKQRQPYMESLDNVNIISQSDLDEIVKKEWERYLTQKALSHVKALFSGVAVRTFELSLLGKNAEEISLELDISKDSVRTLKNRVKLRLVKEIEFLRQEMELKK
ncbi:sigma-70 family RNA polymerase sigma factor [Lentisphaera profundi]|uniref:Sigma-70 family RNA polymerase sigma factor n=1 Tax=Lentisphaera profundi TaxID=1658616 RepID=A0ABY7VUY9_9BACT|nr:sigma-70 family RNA polymerase sigma factor [Lentisphaera profundi]WDE97030.1 sigma-70 family RNA polymerase sigma factor [Lentisphaera profundi]